MRCSTRLCIVSPGCLAIADPLVWGMAFWLMPDGALLIPFGAVSVVIAPGEAAAGFVWLPVVCAQAGAATSIVAISRGVARCASITFIAGFSIVDAGRYVGARTRRHSAPIVATLAALQGIVVASPGGRRRCQAGSGAIPLSASSRCAFSVLSSARPMPRSTCGALVNWMSL